jgi:hypothetical protein
MKRIYGALIDERLVEDSLFLRRGPGMPRLLSPEPVVTNGHLLGNVKRDSTRRWTMWYEQVIPRDPKVEQIRYHTPCLIAHSQDGIHWDKPVMGISDNPIYADHPNVIIGAKQQDANGRFITGLVGMSGLSIIDNEITPHPHATARYTGLLNVFPMDTIGGLVIATSEDGIAWTVNPINPVLIGASDTLNTLLWDAALGKYVIFMRPTIHCGMAAHANRKAARSESDDLVHWTPPRVILDTDERDADAFDIFNEPGMPRARGRSKQFQALSPFILNGCYIAFTWFYDVKLGTFVNEMLHSEDGIHWQREALRELFVADGRPQGFHGKLLCPACDGPIPVDDDYYFYISANMRGHHDAYLAEVKGGDQTQRNKMLAANNIYGFAIKRDRWIGYEAGEAEGEFLSTPIDWEGGSPLYLNVDIRDGGYLRLEIEDQWGRPMKDAHLDEIDTIASPLDEVDHLVTFGPGPKTIMRFPPIGPIRLRVFMKQATLYGWSYVK